MTPQEYGTAYQEGYPRTVRMLRGRGASGDYAEDVAQTAWLQGWRKLDQLRDDSVILGWINMIARNSYRRSAPKQARYQPWPDFEIYSVTGIDLVSMDVSKILDNCRPKDRILFELILSGMTNQEIAEQTGVSAATIRLRLLRARRKAFSHLNQANALRAAMPLSPDVV